MSKTSHIAIDRLNAVLEEPLDVNDRIIQGRVEVFENTPTRMQKNDEAKTQEDDRNQKRRPEEEPSEALTDFMNVALGLCFADYDFSGEPASSYVATTPEAAIGLIEQHVCIPLSSIIPHFSRQLWDALNGEFPIAQADFVYTYNSDAIEDYEDMLFSLFLFFVSRSTKKTVFVQAITRRKPFPKDALSGQHSQMLDCVYRDIYER